MARVLILSSFVAASRVGGGAQALTLARLGIEPILAPTTILGRHPGHGPPGGAAMDAATFEGVLGGVEAQGFVGLDAVLTGHFSGADQVAVAAEAVERVKAAAPSALVVVDPIMGDEERGLYVREPVAEAIAAELVPIAELVAPNAWELARLVNRPVTDPASAVAAARALGRPTLVSSIRRGETIGAVYAAEDAAWFASHQRAPTAPKGTGDLLAAVFVAGLVEGLGPKEALAAAVGAVAEAVVAAGDLDELPIGALPTRLQPSQRVSVSAL